MYLPLGPLLIKHFSCSFELCMKLLSQINKFNLIIFWSNLGTFGLLLVSVKGGYLEFCHLTELKNRYITEIYMKKQYKSSRFKNHKVTNKQKFEGVPLKGYVAS